MSLDSEFVQIVKVAALLRELKHVDISALDALFSFQKIIFFQDGIDVQIFHSMICLLRSDWASSPAVFFRDHYTITHSSGESFFYEHWDSFILETERLMSRLTTQTMKLLNAQVLD